jgi:hypothetical protein
MVRNQEKSYERDFELEILVLIIRSKHLNVSVVDHVYSLSTQKAEVGGSRI